ncbi:pterin operon protein [Halorubrum sp. SS7]|uniref:molybdopterin-dependent oxidoreductase n=1 Tax=Halorubrum sp. SS7 TaxID=2518119 RepID=UPI0010F53226|nr:molybdopterin-dependent oxidoreductase [Halorubrum sp. SS7]TKX58412.1 pterin operon protein [Halorubrum sp. SS7]
MTSSNVGSNRPNAGGAAERSAPDLLAQLDAVRERRGAVTVACRYRCATGTEFGGEWRGVAVAPLLDDAPPETTHLRAESADGYRAHVPVRDALDAVVATERLDGPAAGLPRLVGPDFDSAQTVRDLAALAPVALPPDADPVPGTVDGAAGGE